MLKHKDLKILSILQKDIDNNIKNLGDYPLLNSLGVRIGHALEGVRTNGWQKRNSLPDIINDFKPLVDSYNTVIKYLPKIKILIDEFQRQLDKYETCPICKGKQGVQSQGGRNIRSTWSDCANCEGDGVIKKSSDNNTEWISVDMNNEKTLPKLNTGVLGFFGDDIHIVRLISYGPGLGLRWYHPYKVVNITHWMPLPPPPKPQ